MNIERDVLNLVAQRVRERADSLKAIRRFPKCGIEGWLKVEAVAALGDEVASVQNKGPDLLLRDGGRLELKAATDLNPQYIRDGVLKYAGYCLFLGDGGDRARIAKLSGNGVRLQGKDVFSDGAKDWVIGLLAPELW